MGQVFSVRIPNPRPGVLPAHLVVLSAIVREDGEPLSADDVAAVRAAFPDALAPAEPKAPSKGSKSSKAPAEPRGAKPRRRAAAKRPPRTR